MLTFRDTVIRTDHSSRIFLMPSKRPYILEDLWITHALTFLSSDSSTVLIFDNVKIAPIFALQDEMTIKIERLTVQSKTFVLISNVSIRLLMNKMICTGHSMNLGLFESDIFKLK